MPAEENGVEPTGLVVPPGRHADAVSGGRERGRAGHAGIGLKEILSGAASSQQPAEEEEE
ncbi:hypothetical protein GCM10011383_20460 [Hymenobacter cavernae]|uniref:Uncharacterized protein n=1 Tax=Hymenobacter cavernae TaxID=2044852 RepID=A0ABQ1U653_9BACT|nr:hypothetical protein GCM10011383_20460 [Hymenobacter cavernae]